MSKGKTKIYSPLLFICCCSLWLSCSSYSELLYLCKEVPASLTQVSHTAHSGLIIKPGDKLNIQIELKPDLNELSTEINNGCFAQPIASTADGHRVLTDGKIIINGIGSFPAAGQTTEQLAIVLKEELSKYYISPVVRVSLLPWQFTILGHVNKPGLYSTSNEKLNMFEALGLAGDLQIHGNRKRILVIRSDNHKTHFQYLNLQNASAIQSPYFYLRQNDIIYVEPRKSMAFSIHEPSTKMLPWVGLGSALINLIALLFR